MEKPLKRTRMQLPLIPPKTLYCDRIRDLSIDKNRLSVLLAPAGFGKTTAVLLSLKEYRERIWWYRLEQEDIFLNVFYQHLIDVLFAGKPQILQDQKRLLRSLQNLKEEYSILNAQICQDLTYLYSDSKETHFLVFDDFQWVTDEPAFVMILTYFVRNMPENVKLVITSRTDPKIFSGKLCMNYTCRQYTAKDLLFTPEEVRILIEHVYCFRFTPEQYELILQRSQGWAAGVYILSHSIENQMNIGNDSNFLSEIDSMFSLFFLEYLVGIDEENKNKLIELAMLDDFSLDELNDLFHQEKPDEFLNWLVSSQLCFQADMNGQTRYYFHSLITDELRRKFLNSYTVKEQNAFFIRVADYYLSHHDLIRGIEFCLKAGDTERAFSISSQFARECFSGGVPERFFPVLSLYSSEEVRQNPYLLLMEGMRVLNTDRVRSQMAFVQALVAFRQLGDYLFLMNSFGMLMVVAYQHRGFAALQETSKFLPVSSIVLKGGAARTLLTISQFISCVGRDKLKQAAVYLKYLDRKNIHEKMWNFSYYMIRGIYFYRRGDLARSRENMKIILSHPVMHLDDQWRIIGLVSCCYVAFLQSDLELLQYFISEFSLLAERLHSDFALGYAQYLRSILYHIHGDTAEALASMLRSKEAYSAFGSHVLKMDTELMSFIISEATSQEMIYKARVIVDCLKKENPSHGLEELSTATLAILLKRAGEFDEAERLLMESVVCSERKGAEQSAHALYLQLADLYFLSGKKEAGNEYFRKWVRVGRKNRYLYSVPFTHASLRRVVVCCSATPEEASYVQEVVQFYESAHRKNRSEHFVNVQLLGSFSVQTRGKKLTEKDFKTRKVSGLLKYILVRGQPQSRERLAAIFWPESDRKSSGTSLRVALYELRKVLAGIGVGFDSEEALLKEGREGFSLNDSHVIVTDIQKMEDLYKKWRSSAGENDLSLLMELCDTYRGAFLENGEYDDWVTIQREYYAGIYYEALHALGEEAIRLSCPAAEKYILRGIELDPLDEVCYSHLIALYEQEGQSDRAEAIRRQFKKRFKCEMGFEADI